ncbi:hypothetical protein FVR03_01355 [Pontibacter qinzhouensis]|uniref:Uncharacterized protein n=1 Tax=Pontibacter qinzhouensis TaxID=2603253 RepID=A0A5C8KDU8_9BACT|nr:hypothetical protein [Pontibacter qinzhouensis]TXK52391.1 hypothetical protein FVR03_01355 [Pontibacter qinzhouensis]
MVDKQLLSQVAATVTEKPIVEVTITVKKRSFWDKLFRRPDKRLFEVKPTTVSSMYLMGERSILWDEKLFALLGSDDPANNIANALAVINANLEDVMYACAVVIQNDGKPPKKTLLKWLEDNTDALDLASIIVPLLGSTHMQAFLNSIVLVKGTGEVLKPKTSLKETGEMIAPGV